MTHLDAQPEEGTRPQKAPFELDPAIWVQFFPEEVESHNVVRAIGNDRTRHIGTVYRSRSGRGWVAHNQQERRGGSGISSFMAAHFIFDERPIPTDRIKELSVPNVPLQRGLTPIARWKDAKGKEWSIEVLRGNNTGHLWGPNAGWKWWLVDTESVMLQPVDGDWAWWIIEPHQDGVDWAIRTLAERAVEIE